MYKPRGEFIPLTPDWFRLYAKYEYRGAEIMYFKNAKTRSFAAKSNCGEILRAISRESIAEAIDTLLDGKK